MGAKKKAAAVCEGPELVRAVLEILAEDPKATFWPKRVQKKPKPLSAARIAALAREGCPLPPSMQTWLTLGSDIEGLDFGTTEAWHVASLAEHATQRFGEMAGHLVGLSHPKFDAPCLVLREEAGNKLEVLYLSAPDSTGEYPILQAYLENEGYSHIALWHPGFDVFLASQLKPERAQSFGVPGGGECVDAADPQWGGRMKMHLKALGMKKAQIKLGR